MPLIPMKQTITVKRGGSLDAFGYPTAGTETTIKCRLDEGSSLVQNRSEGRTNSEIEVATARIFLDGLVDVGYEDTIEFTNELGETIERKPKEINVKRSLAGKPIMTEVVI